MRKKRILFSTCLALALSGYCGNIAVAQTSNVKYEQVINSKPLTSVLKDLEERFGTKIVFSYEDLEAYKVNAHVKANSAKDALNQILAGIPVSYTINNGTISVKVAAKAQTVKKVTVSGKVLDSKGYPIPAATIMLQGKKGIGTITDDDGNFSMNLEQGKGETLLFSFLGMKTSSYFVNCRKSVSNITVTLSDDNHLLDEVVVTGYQTISKERATGAFGSINSKQLEAKLNSDLKNVIEGQVAGVVLDKDGNISIRGISTLKAETKPLLVVDGYPTEGDLSDLNPENIENVTVLKDGVAASIYGSRSANGVIVVTTKNGLKGKAKVSYQGTFKFEPKPDLDYLHMANTSDYIDAEIELFNQNSSYYSISDEEDNLSEIEYLLVAQKAGLMTEQATNEQINKLRGYNFLSQMKKYMFRTAFQQMHNVSISGGNDDVTYNLAVNYTNNRSSYINTKDNRLIVDFKNTWKPFKFLTVGVSANLKYSRAKSPNTSWQTLTDYTDKVKPYTQLVDENGNLTNIRTVSLALQNTFDKVSGLKDVTYNPINDAYQDYNTTQNFGARLNAYMHFDIWNGISADFGGTWSRTNTTYKSISEANSYDMRLAYNSMTSKKNNSNHYVPDGDMINESRSNNENWTIRTQINYKGQFGPHRISALAGNEVRRISTDSNSYETRLGYNSTAGSFSPFNIVDFKSNTFKQDLLYGNTLSSAISYGSYGLRDNRFVSWYFNGSYEYDDRYLVSGSVREDLTNFFGTNPKYRHKPLWSIGGTWKINNEKFFHADWVSRLNLRASYGVNGNISLSEGPYLILSAGSYNSTTGGVSNSIASYPNNSLRWEKTKTTNIGIDADFLNGRVGLSFDYYLKKSSDLLAKDAIDPTTGTSSMTKNVGAIDNRGFELSIHGTPVKTKDFSWDAVYNLSINKNKVKKYNVSRKYSTSWAYTTPIQAEGYPMYGFFGYHFAGLNEKGETLIYDAQGEKTLASNAKVEDVYYQGTAIPKADMSLTNTFNYKSWTLSFMFIAKLGHKYRKDCFQGSNYNNRYVGQRWKQAGDEEHTIYPNLQSWNMDLFYFPFCDVNVGNASYLKMRDLTLSYNFDKNLLSHIGLSNARIYLQARNLFRVTAKGCDIDPEAFENNFSGGMGASSNAGYASLPLSKEFYIGVSFGF